MSSRESTELLNAQNADAEKRGFFGRMKAKMQQRNEDKRERDAERAKSPPRIHPDQANSRSSLSAFAHEHLSPRGRSFDRPRDELLPAVQEKRHEGSGSKTPIPPPPQASQTLSQMATTTPASAPVSAVPLQPRSVTPGQATQRAPDSAPATAAPTAPSTAPLVAAAPGPVPILAPAAVLGSGQEEKPAGIPPTEHAQASTQMPVQQSVASTQPFSAFADQAPAQTPVAEPRPIQEVIQQQPYPWDAAPDKAPPSPRWTKISKSVVSPEVLEQMGEDFEELEQHVIVKRVVPHEELQQLASKTTARPAAEATRDNPTEQHSQESQSASST